MQPILSYILDYSIGTQAVSVVNSDKGVVYFVPYDGLFFDEILFISPYVGDNLDEDEMVDSLNFSITCTYSHIDADNFMNAKYELRLGQTLLATEYARIIPKMRSKPNTLLRSARKCARKVITQERLALKNHLIKTFRTDMEHDS